MIGRRVDIPGTDGVMIADTVQIGTGTTILPGTILLGTPPSARTA